MRVKRGSVAGECSVSNSVNVITSSIFPSDVWKAVNGDTHRQRIVLVRLENVRDLLDFFTAYSKFAHVAVKPTDRQFDSCCCLEEVVCCDQ